jgi:hypothetical protein
MPIDDDQLSRLKDGVARTSDKLQWDQHREALAGELWLRRQQDAARNSRIARRRARSDDGDSSKRAAKLQAGRAGPVHRTIVNTFKGRPGLALSARQMEQELAGCGYGFSTVRKRFGELALAGVLIDAEQEETNCGRAPARQFRLVGGPLPW